MSTTEDLIGASFGLIDETLASTTELAQGGTFGLRRSEGERYAMRAPPWAVTARTASRLCPKRGGHLGQGRYDHVGLYAEFLHGERLPIDPERSEAETL
jgi:hypothetical protein